MQLGELLALLVRVKGSDLHFSVGEPPIMRVQRADATGLIPAFEIMIATPGIRNLIRERKTHQIPSLIQSAGDIGMQTFHQSLLELYSERLITAQEALAKANDPQEFRHRADIGPDDQEAA